MTRTTTPRTSRAPAPVPSAGRPAVLAARLVPVMALLMGGLLAPLTASAQSRPTLESLDGRLARIERVLDQSLLDQLQRIDALQREIRELRGELERLDNGFETLEKRDRALNADTDRRITDLEKARGAGGLFGDGFGGVDSETGEPLPGLGGTPGGLDETASGGGRGLDETQGAAGARANGAAGSGSSSPGVFVGAQDGGRGSERSGAGRRSAGIAPLALADFGDGPKPPDGPLRDTASQAEKTSYTQAYDLLARGQNEAAVESFDKFLKSYPDGPYSDNAWYWQGEAMYADRRFDDAVRNFSVVVNAFPASTKVPDARLKIGFSRYEQEDYAGARELLTGVQDDYPGRSAAVLARKRLQQMDREGR